MEKLKIFFSACVFLLLTNVIFSQETKNLQKTNEIENEFSVQIALSNIDYMVTAGDVYSLTYTANGVPVSYSILVEPNYKIRVSNLAVLVVNGMSYIELKRQVEEIVQKNYPLSGVQFVLRNPSRFKVTIKGEVTNTTEKSVWALSRLSSVLEGVTTPYSSDRDIQIISENGKKRTCDLFKAKREGDYTHNPYLRPGDTIVISRINRLVTIDGQVERPGTYELMRDENLKKLISYYGNSLTEYADTSRITLVRKTNTDSKGGKTLYLTKEDLDNDYPLYNGDFITIGSYSELLPSIIVEGIINNPNPTAKNATNEGAEKAESPIDFSYRTSVSFYEGENYASFVRRINTMFSTYSDLQNAYIERKGMKIPMNIEKCLFDKEYKSEYLPSVDDKLVIPFQQNFQKVLVKGEVLSVVEENAWPLRRLSTIIGDNKTEFSSTRNVIVTGVDGQQNSYDLFKAYRYGEMDQDPYVRSGETITVQRLDRIVTIQGQVERPGTYELLEGENLNDLIYKYGSGLRNQADISRVTISRKIDANYPTGEKIYLTEEDAKSNYVLKSYDSVYIDSYSSLMPVMFMEGAFAVSEEDSLQASNRTSIQFEPGTHYSELIKNYKEWFRSTSDIQHAYIIRGEETIPYDLTKVLYDADYYDNLEVLAHDTLLIPYKQNFVTVSGAVAAPGRYPYIPDRTYEYYVGLAGGFIKEKNAGHVVTIVDINGKNVKKSEFITPECNITAATNSFTYYFNQYAPIITTTLSIVMTGISIWAATSSAAAK